MEGKVIKKKRLFHCSQSRGREREKGTVRFSLDSELWFWWNAEEAGSSCFGGPGEMLWFNYFKHWVRFSGLAEAGL